MYGKIFMAVAVLMTGAFCFGAEPAPAEKAGLAPAAGKFAERERAVADKFIGALAESLKSGDFAAFKAVQRPDGKAFPEERFKKMHSAFGKQFGKLVAAERLGVLDQGRVRDHLWKFTFERESGEKLRREIVCWVRVGIENGEPMIAGFSFNFF